MEILLFVLVWTVLYKLPDFVHWVRDQHALRRQWQLADEINASPNRPSDQQLSLMGLKVSMVMDREGNLLGRVVPDGSGCYVHSRTDSSLGN